MDIKKLIKRLDKLNEIYSHADNEYVQRIDNIRQSRQGVINWQKYRFHYQIGINRANRQSPYKDLRKSILDDNPYLQAKN